MTRGISDQLHERDSRLSFVVDTEADPSDVDAALARFLLSVVRLDHEFLDSHSDCPKAASGRLDNKLHHD